MRFGRSIASMENPFIRRGRLRDIIFTLSLISALTLRTDELTCLIAVFLLFLGCFLHFVTKGTLIRNRVLCTRGPYALVRHPYYLANYLIDSSFCVLSGSPLMLIGYPFLFHLFYGKTVEGEEETLFRLHKGSFLRYAESVPRLFPNISSLKGVRCILRGFSFDRISLNEVIRLARFIAMETFVHTAFDRNRKPRAQGRRQDALLRDVWPLLLLVQNRRCIFHRIGRRQRERP